MDGLEEVVGGDRVGAGEVGDGARDLEDAVVGAGGEVELLHGLLEKLAERRIDGAMLADLRVRHAGVGAGARAGEAGALAEARGLDAGADGGRRFARAGSAAVPRR